MSANNTQPATLYIVRHGETVWNLKDILQGHRDSPLTERGLEQARRLAESLAGVHFDVVFSSDLLRAKRTSELLALERQLAVTTSKLLRERNWGRYDGRPADEFRRESREILKEYDRLSREEQWRFKYYEDIESHEEIFGRIMAFLREVAVAYPGKSILVVSHYDVLRTLLLHLGENPTRIDNLAYLVIRTDGVEIELQETYGVLLGEPAHA